MAAAIGWLLIILTLCLAFAANMWLRSFVRATLLEQHSQSLETTPGLILGGDRNL